MKKSFDGFQEGKYKPIIKLPAQFFQELLPLIDDLAELKVTLFCFYGLMQRDGEFRFLLASDFTGSEALMRALDALDDELPADEILARALKSAIERGTLLTAAVTLDEMPVQLYFLNSERGQHAITQLEAGLWYPDHDQLVAILPPRQSIYSLYEENIGAMTPLIADELKAAEEEYPPDWIEEAIRIAVNNNKRSWRYISTILERWNQEGKTSDEVFIRNRRKDEGYVPGQYDDFINS